MNSQVERGSRPRTRRTVLTGAATAAMASVLASRRTEAAPGDPILQGRANNAGRSRTALASTAPSMTLHVSNTSGRAIVARTSNRNAIGIYAANTAQRSGDGAALRAEATRLDGVQGRSRARDRAGVVGVNRTRDQRARGVVGLASTGVGVLGIATRRRAGWGVVSAGDTLIDGDLFVNGRILQPAAAASGTVDLDSSGTARVQIVASQRDARYDYQLTAVGMAMPNLHVVEATDGSFTIKGGKPGGRVSWHRARRTDAALTAQSALGKQLPDLSAYTDR